MKIKIKNRKNKANKRIVILDMESKQSRTISFQTDLTADEIRNKIIELFEKI